jgi:general secretion pathway protein L
MRIFFRWWVEQLADLLPRGVIGWLRCPPDAVLLRPALRGALASIRRAGRVVPLGEVGGPPELAALARAGRPAAPALVLVVAPEDWVLRKTIVLPAAALGHLRRVLAHEIARETPFTPDELVWDYAIRKLLPGGAAVEVELAFVPRERIAPFTAVWHGSAVAPAALELPLGGGMRYLGLGAARRRAAARRLPLTAGCAVASLLLLSIAPLLRQSLALADSESRMAAAQAEASAAGALRQELDTLKQTAELIAAERQRGPAALRVVAELTRLIPDDSHLVSLAVQSDRMSLTGFSPDASKLIGLLSASFQEPAFAGPVVRAAGGGLESFSITAAPMSARAP